MVAQVLRFQLLHYINSVVIHVISYQISHRPSSSMSLTCYSSTIPKNAPTASTQTRFPEMAGRTAAALLAASEELAFVLLTTSVGVLLASAVGLMLVSIDVAVPLVSDVVKSELLVVLLDMELLIVALARAAARCE